MELYCHWVGLSLSALLWVWSDFPIPALSDMIILMEVGSISAFGPLRCRCFSMYFWILVNTVSVAVFIKSYI